jgi:hypothetical protein
MHQRTFAQERRVSARRGWANACRQTRALFVGRSPMVCGGRRCIRVYTRHGGLTPPALVLQCECLPAKQRFLRCTNVHSPKSGGRQPAVAGQTRIRRHEPYWSADRRRCVCGSPLRSRLWAPRLTYAPESYMRIRVRITIACIGATGGLRPPLLRCTNVCRRNIVFTMHKRTFDQERRASARRGWANAHPQTRALLVGRPPTVCGVAVAFAFIRATGGLRPPLLCCSANVCRRNINFYDAPTYIRPRAAGVSPPWLLGKRTCRNFAVKSRETAGTMPTNAGAVAFVCHGWLTPAAPGCTTFVRCGMRDSQCGVARTTKSGGRQPAGDGVTHSGSNIGHLGRPLLRTKTESGIRESTVLQIQPGAGRCAGRSRRGHKNFARFSCLRRRLSEPRKIERFRA